MSLLSLSSIVYHRPITSESLRQIVSPVVSLVELLVSVV